MNVNNSSEFLDLSSKLVEAATLREQVADILRAMILKGDFEAGEHLSERQLCQSFNISTTPIKEALRILQTEGLVYTIPRKGTFGSNVLGDRIRQSIMMRASLEGIAAGFAARDCTDSEIKRLEAILRKTSSISESEKTPDWERLISLNDEFHGIIRDACQNDYLINLIRSLRTVDYSLRSISFKLPNAVEIHRQSQIEHDNILQAVKARNSEDAENLMRLHIRAFAERVLNGRI